MSRRTERFGFGQLSNPIDKTTSLQENVTVIDMPPFVSPSEIQPRASVQRFDH
ncbi:predicted protein [Sclerotinia sclerotiorum 1980 UF-70]|uniref:Uncharacterized protein n=1 Tax=Sclerotinia sclerotiorum (strain ATCC 18683 / 1980 / Ss-1) TaxID=665079 RepID=A7F131_SCLS1|nr:predicted protein [Sclerotinia sclerotiorum 1980 UF-70]EDN95423.1 predicted protein [Sclerotinia sclerotiorum 1980 UF-70]